MSARSRQHDTLPPAVPFRSLTVVLLALAAGVAVALVMLPAWLPHMSTSLLGPEPKAFMRYSTCPSVCCSLVWPPGGEARRLQFGGGCILFAPRVG